MEFEEALKMIIDGLSDIEKYDEALAVIKDAVKGTEEKEGEYEKKYNELSEKYRTRFKEEIKKSTEPEKVEKVEEEKEITLDQLDFSGKNE